MNLELISEKINPLLQRREAVVQVSEFTSTPSRTELIEELGKVLKNAEKEGFYITKVDNQYGKKKIKVYVHVYSSKAALDKTVHVKRMRTSGKKKKAGA